MKTIGSSLIAERYARAIKESIEDTESLANDTKIIKDALNSDEILTFLSSAIVSKADKINVFSDIVEHIANKEIFFNLFELLINKGRISLIIEILDEINLLILKENDTEIVNVKIAEEISEGTFELIKAKIESILHKKVIMNTVIDPAIIGGFIAESHSLRIDGSVKNNLVRFKEMIRK